MHSYVEAQIRFVKINNRSPPRAPAIIFNIFGIMKHPKYTVNAGIQSV